MNLETQPHFHQYKQPEANWYNLDALQTKNSLLKWIPLKIALQDKEGTRRVNGEAKGAADNSSLQTVQFSLAQKKEWL